MNDTNKTIFAILLIVLGLGLSAVVPRAHVPVSLNAVGDLSAEVSVESPVDATIEGLHATAGFAAYNLSKAGLVMLAQNQAVALQAMEEAYD